MEAVKSRLARGYSRAAPTYEALASHHYLAGIRRLLPRLRVPPMAAILDVGSGTGVNLLEAARWFAPTRALHGIDLSPGMVEIARAKAQVMSIPAQFTVGDAEQLPYSDGQFDVVLCNSVLHWFKDKGRALREMRRVLRPGGQVALICAAAPGFQEWFSLIDRILQAAIPGHRESSMPEFPTGAEVAHLLQSSGFGIEHLANPVHLQRIYEPENFVRLMATVAPHWSADLPPEAQALVEQMVVTMMRQGWPEGFPNTWAAVEAVATRIT